MFESELAQLEQSHLLRKPVVIDYREGTRVTINGKSVLLMCSNDYLGISGHPSLREAANAAMVRHGFGSGAARLVSGTSPIHEELESRIARFKGTEAAMLFNSGYAANAGIIPAIAGERDVVLSDSLNHASIVDGCRLSRARVSVFRHRDMNHLEELLHQTRSAGRRLIVTDGVFSMDGDIAPLKDMAALAERYDALLMVDDAHATGVLGKCGRGTAEHFGIEGRVPVQMGTLGKALGSFGAYVAGSRSLIEYLANRARSYVYSTALPPAICAASIAAIGIVENEPALRQKLQMNRKRIIDEFKNIGVDTGNSESPIVPVMIGRSEQALKIAARLFDCGVYATAIRPPTVPDGTARIRMTVSAGHSEEDIDLTLKALMTCREEGLLS